MIELLVVLVILGLLAGIVAPQFFGKIDGSKVKTAETQVKLLKMALQTYRLDVGRFPDTLEQLNDEPAGEKFWNGPYLEEEIPLDPWGSEYVYERSREARQGFYLYSYGADSLEGGEGLDADVGYVPES